MQSSNRPSIIILFAVGAVASLWFIGRLPRLFSQTAEPATVKIQNNDFDDVIVEVRYGTDVSHAEKATAFDDNKRRLRKTEIWTLKVSKDVIYRADHDPIHPGTHMGDWYHIEVTAKHTYEVAVK